MGMLMTMRMTMMRMAEGDDENDKIVTCFTETWVLKGSQILFGTNLVLSSFWAENFFILCPEAIVM